VTHLFRVICLFLVVKSSQLDNSLGIRTPNDFVDGLSIGISDRFLPPIADAPKKL